MPMPELDPTERTTEQLLRVVQSAEELLELRVEALSNTLDEKLRTVGVQLSGLAETHAVWVGVMSTYRKEDARAVEVALTAVQKAAMIHAEAHSAQHIAHQDIHLIEKGALDKASEQLDRRLEGMNGIRNQLREQAVRFVDSDVAEVRNAAIERRLDLNRKDLEELRLVMATKVSKDDTRMETRTTDRQDSRADANLRISLMVGMGGLMIGVLGLIFALIHK